MSNFQGKGALHSFQLSMAILKFPRGKLETFIAKKVKYSYFLYFTDRKLRPRKINRYIHGGTAVKWWDWNLN